VLIGGGAVFIAGVVVVTFASVVDLALR